MRLIMISCLCIICLLSHSCKDNSTEFDDFTDNSSIIFGRSIEGVKIGDDSSTVIGKLGKPNDILLGDFIGYIFHYTEGKLKNTSVLISYDRAFGFGVVSVDVDSFFQGKSKDNIGIGSNRNFVISKIGNPDRTDSYMQVVSDIYKYKRNIFTITYKNKIAIRISMNRTGVYN